MKIKTVEKLQDRLNEDFAWRKKELIDFQMMIHSTKNRTICRMGLALLCAHFEGFLKRAANYYIVFVSSHDNYVHHSFVAMPLYFIRKEKLIPDLKECMQLLKKVKSERKMEVTIQNERIKLANVLYIESNKNNVYYVFLNRKKLKMRTTLRKIEKELINYNFIRCHASFVVNMSQIRKVTSDFIFLDKDEKIPIGEKYYMNFLDKYADYKFRKK